MQQRRITPLHYQIFLFCLWEEQVNASIGSSVWRFSLENPHTGQRIGFKDLAELMGYLLVQIKAAQSEERTGLS